MSFVKFRSRPKLVPALEFQTIMLQRTQRLKCKSNTADQRHSLPMTWEWHEIGNFHHLAPKQKLDLPDHVPWQLLDSQQIYTVPCFWWNSKTQTGNVCTNGRRANKVSSVQTSLAPQGVNGRAPTMKCHTLPTHLVATDCHIRTGRLQLTSPANQTKLYCSNEEDVWVEREQEMSVIFYPISQALN